MVGGELFVPKIPSMNMLDLAKALAPECKTKIIGIRAGEKINEVMIPKDDAYRAIEYDDKYVIMPEHDFFPCRFDINGGKPVAEGFEYNSETNPLKLSIDEAREMIATI
jgi:UDP-N-acetylglucosamine 4,6-dehydratase